MFKTSKLLLILPFLALMLLPLSAQAFTAETGQSINFDKNKTVEGNYYTAGSNITIDGTIKGDLICAGQSVNINGSVEGDVICAAQSININGKIGGSVRVLSNTVNINGQVAKNLMIGATTVNTSASSTVGGEGLLASAIADLRGRINGDLSAAVSNLSLGGTVVKNVNLKLGDKNQKDSGLVILDAGYIGGNLTYTDTNEAKISSQARIVGKINHQLPQMKNTNPANNTAAWLLGRIYSIFGAIIIGLVLVSLWGSQLKRLTDQMLQRVAPTIGWGSVVLILTPVIALILVVTLIGIPLSALLILVWLIMLWLSKIITAILIGRTFLERFWSKRKENLLLALSLGVLASWLLFSIPFIGGLLALVAMLWGLGGIFLYFKHNS